MSLQFAKGIVNIQEFAKAFLGSSEPLLFCVRIGSEVPLPSFIFKQSSHCYATISMKEYVFILLITIHLIDSKLMKMAKLTRTAD